MEKCQCSKEEDFRRIYKEIEKLHDRDNKLDKLISEIQVKDAKKEKDIDFIKETLTKLNNSIEKLNNSIENLTIKPLVKYEKVGFVVVSTVVGGAIGFIVKSVF